MAIFQGFEEAIDEKRLDLPAGPDLDKVIEEIILDKKDWPGRLPFSTFRHAALRAAALSFGEHLPEELKREHDPVVICREIIKHDLQWRVSLRYRWSLERALEKKKAS